MHAANTGNVEAVKILLTVAKNKHGSIDIDA